MQFTEAQQDMDNAYFGGGPGVLVSGLIWILAGLVGVFHSAQFIYGAFIGGITEVIFAVVLIKQARVKG